MKINNTFGELIVIAKNVLSKYDILPENIKIIQNDGLKTLWKFSHNNKIMCLKRLRHSKDKATFSVNAQLYIYNNGGNVPQVYLNSQGEPITEYMEQLFVLYEWINSRDLNFTRPSDFYLGLEALAKFHVVSKGYTAPEDAKVSSKLGKWPKQYESMRDRMLKWKEEAKVNSSKASYNSYLQYVDYIIDLCNMAIDDIKKSSYSTLTSVKPEESSLCHQDYGTGNAILSSNGVYVIDLDGVTYDLPNRDLRKIIGKRAEKQGKWEKNDIESILQYYEKYNVLSPEEKDILKIDLLFPHWFFGTIKNIFQKNKLVNPSKIRKIATLEQSKLSILNQWH